MVLFGTDVARRRDVVAAARVLAVASLAIGALAVLLGLLAWRGSRLVSNANWDEVLSQGLLRNLRWAIRFWMRRLSSGSCTSLQSSDFDDRRSFLLDDPWCFLDDEPSDLWCFEDEWDAMAADSTFSTFSVASTDISAAALFRDDLLSVGVGTWSLEASGGDVGLEEDAALGLCLDSSGSAEPTSSTMILGGGDTMESFRGWGEDI